MTGLVPLEEAEVRIDGVTSVTVESGTKVDLGRGWIAVVTLDGILCGCGKGVLCPRNPQFRMATGALADA